MPFCPRCHDEYRDGFAVCGDCGVPLVDRLPTEAETARMPGSRQRQQLLIVTVDEEQSRTATVFLISHGIQVYVRGREADGSSVFSDLGEDICVDMDDFDRATELLREMPQAGAMEDDEPASWDDEDEIEAFDDPDAGETDPGSGEPAMPRMGKGAWLAVALVCGGAAVLVYLIVQMSQGAVSVSI